MERNQTEYDRDMTDAVSASLTFKQHVKHQNKTENLHATTGEDFLFTTVSAARLLNHRHKHEYKDI